MSFGDRVKKYRKLRNLSQGQLAEQMGMVHTGISKIENDQRKLTFEEAVQLAQALEVSLAELAGVEEPSPGFSADVLQRVDHCRKAGRTALEHVQAVIDDLDVLVGAP